MKILILSNLTSYTYNFRYEILQKMVESGHDVVIACHNDDEGKQIGTTKGLQFKELLKLGIIFRF